MTSHDPALVVNQTSLKRILHFSGFPHKQNISPPTLGFNLVPPKYRIKSLLKSPKMLICTFALMAVIRHSCKHQERPKEFFVFNANSTTFCALLVDCVERRQSRGQGGWCLSNRNRLLLSISFICGL